MQKNPMNIRVTSTAIIFVISTMTSLSAQGQQPKSTLVFEDRFERNESVVGNEWKLNSKEEHTFALRAGELHVTRNPKAKHSANLLHKAKFRNGTMEFRFKLVTHDDSLVIQFRDAAFKETKQGRLFQVTIGSEKVELQDAVVGSVINKAIKSAGATSPTPEQQEKLDKCTTAIPTELNAGQWYAAVIGIQGSELNVAINGKLLGSLNADSIGHTTKENFRLSIDRSLVLDDVKLFSHGK